MDIVDRIASVALRIASRRLAVLPEGLGNGDLDRLVETIPLPSSPIPAIERAFERHVAHLDSTANKAA